MKVSNILPDTLPSWLYLFNISARNNIINFVRVVTISLKKIDCSASVHFVANHAKLALSSFKKNFVKMHYFVV